MADDEKRNAETLIELLPQFLQYARVELSLAPQSLQKYQDRLRQVAKICGDKDVTAFEKKDIYLVKEVMMKRGLSPVTIATTLLAFKRFLTYARDELKLSALDPCEIHPPKRPRREVLFLTAPEVQQFVSSIRTVTHRGTSHIAGIRFKALVEALLGSALRIGELLSIDRTQIDFEKGEAKIVGKGNIERMAFFTERALHALTLYIEGRTDENPALFVTTDGLRRLQRTDLWRSFKHYSCASGLSKPIRPHILRHTAATVLLFNGCPIGHIKEVLGHARLETTCRYYLGVDKRAAKEAHKKFLHYDERSERI